MVIERRGLTDPYSNLGAEYPGYDVGEETGTKEINIYFDKSQQITNYIVNLNVTGQGSLEWQTPSVGTSISYIIESEISQKLIEVLAEIEEALDDPALFEGVLSKFLCLFEELFKREDEREIYFSDLLSILKMGLLNIECNDLSQGGIGVIREALVCLGRELTQQKLEELRNKLRENGIDILRPFKCNINIKSVLREMYPDEVST